MERPAWPAPTTTTPIRSVTLRPQALENRSVLEDEAPLDLVAAREAVALRAERVRDVIARNDHVIELPDGAVLLHARDRVVDVELPGDAVRLARERAFRIQPHREDDLIFLRDLDPLRIDVHFALLARVYDLPVEPDSLDRVGVRIVVVEVLDRADLALALLRARHARVDLPHALGGFGLFRHLREPTPLGPLLALCSAHDIPRRRSSRSVAGRGPTRRRRRRGSRRSARGRWRWHRDRHPHHRAAARRQSAFRLQRDEPFYRWRAVDPGLPDWCRRQQA